MNKQKKIIIIALSVLVLVVGFFLFQRGKDISEEKKITVVASFYPLFNLAEEIGGERAKVINLTPPGKDPRNLNPSARDIARIKTANLFLYNGAGLEPWVKDIKNELEEAGVVVLDMSSYFRTIKKDGGEDPHIWLDPLIFKEKMKIILNALIDIDKEGEDYYRHNAKRAFAYLEELHTKYKNNLARCQFGEVKVSEDVLGYLAKRYNFKTKVVDKNEETISFNTAISPSEKELKDGDDYFSIMRKNLEELRTALNCH